MARDAPSAHERELLEAAASQARTNLSDFIRRKAVEAAETDLFFATTVTISAEDWQKFEAWAREKKIRYVPALSNPAPGDDWKGETGFIQVVVDKHVSAPSNADAYLAGPPIMVREAVRVLGSKGIGKERIHFDEIAVQ